MPRLFGAVNLRTFKLRNLQTGILHHRRTIVRHIRGNGGRSRTRIAESVFNDCCPRGSVSQVRKICLLYENNFARHPKRFVSQWARQVDVAPGKSQGFQVDQSCDQACRKSRTPGSRVSCGFRRCSSPHRITCWNFAPVGSPARQVARLD